MAEACVSVYEAKERLASNQLLEREEWRRIEDRPRFSGIGTISNRISGRGFGQGNQAVAEKERNLLELEGQVIEGNRVSYAEVVGEKCHEKSIEFPDFRPQGRLSCSQFRPLQVDELENEEVCLIEQKEDRGGRFRLRKREQMIREIVDKLRDELRVDILRIIREEVRENLRSIIGDSIKEEFKILFQEGGTSMFRKAARDSVEENIRERVVGSLNEVNFESESGANERSTEQK